MPPNPSALQCFEWFKHNNKHPRSTLFMYRLRWDPFSSPDPEKSIAVIKDVTDAHSPQTGYSANHPIANQPATDPPVRSIIVAPHDLTLWLHNWLQKHLLDHALKDPSKGVWRRAKRTEHPDDKHGRILMNCCNEDRPPSWQPEESPNLEVEVWATSRPFVTVHDYLTTVHNYLQTHKALILAAKGLSSHLDGPFPAEEPGRQLYFLPTSIAHPYFFEETPLYRSHDMDWESLADMAKSEIKNITINYLYNTFPPELPTREFYTSTRTQQLPGSEPTVLTEVSWSDQIRGSNRKAMEMNMYELLYGPPKLRRGALSDEEMAARVRRSVHTAPMPRPWLYPYIREYCPTKDAWVSRFGDKVTCPAWRLDTLRWIGR